MDTKKTILVSVLTTLATMFVVAAIVHMCKSHCGNANGCAKAKSHCSMTYSHGGGHGMGNGCGMSKSSCKKMKSCHKKKSCAGMKSCSSDDMTTDIDVTVTEDGGKKIIKKVIKKEIED